METYAGIESVDYVHKVVQLLCITTGDLRFVEVFTSRNRKSAKYVCNLQKTAHRKQFPVDRCTVCCARKTRHFFELYLIGTWTSTCIGIVLLLGDGNVFDCLVFGNAYVVRPSAS